MRTVAVLTMVGALLGTIHSHAAGQDSDPAGSWEMSMETPRGSMTQTLMLHVTDGEWGGTLRSPRGEAELTDVTFADGQLQFSVVRSLRGNTVTQRFSAVISGSGMTGTISGGPGGERPFTAVRSN